MSSQIVSTRVPMIYGAAGLGHENTNVKVTDPAAIQALLDAYARYGGHAIDTSRLYGAGSSEEMLGRSNIHDAVIDTKVFPISPGDHEPPRLKALFAESLKALAGHKIRIFYLHAADRSVPFEHTVRAVHELYTEGHFEQFGLSNFYSYEVSEIVGICRANGYVLPTAYEGVYNVLDRTIEAELVPCLRKFGIKLAGYCPLAGGFLTGLYLEDTAQIETGSHFDTKLSFGTWFTSRYFPMRNELRKIKDVGDAHGIPLAEVALRWLQHHSALTPDDLGIIIGGSKPEQIESGFLASSKGPLPEKVIDVLDEAWLNVKARVPLYAF